jgi:hypothetical protein
MNLRHVVKKRIGKPETRTEMPGMVSNPNFGDHSGDHHFDVPSIFAHNLTKQLNIKTNLTTLTRKDFSDGNCTVHSLYLKSLFHASCYFDRPSAPAQESMEEAPERNQVLADARALKHLAVVHPKGQPSLRIHSPKLLLPSFC